LPRKRTPLLRGRGDQGLTKGKRGEHRFWKEKRKKNPPHGVVHSPMPAIRSSGREKNPRRSCRETRNRSWGGNASRKGKLGGKIFKDRGEAREKNPRPLCTERDIVHTSTEKGGVRGETSLGGETWKRKRIWKGNERCRRLKSPFKKVEIWEEGQDWKGRVRTGQRDFWWQVVARKKGHFQK